MFFQRYLDMHVHSFFTSHYISKSRKLLASHEIFRHWVTECVWPQVAPKSLIDLKKCKSCTRSIGVGVFGVRPLMVGASMSSVTGLSATHILAVWSSDWVFWEYRYDNIQQKKKPDSLCLFFFF